MLGIYFVTENTKMQAVLITEENVQEVAEWVGARAVHYPIRKNIGLGERNRPWFYFGDAANEATIDHWMIRGKSGTFYVKSESQMEQSYTFHNGPDFKENNEPS